MNLYEKVKCVIQFDELAAPPDKMNKSNRFQMKNISENYLINNASTQPSSRISKLFFDRRDYELIRVVNTVYSGDRYLDYARRQYYKYFSILTASRRWRSQGDFGRRTQWFICLLPSNSVVSMIGSARWILFGPKCWTLPRGQCP